MPDPIETPDEHANSRQQGDPGENAETWKTRYTGLVRKVEELTLTNRDLTSQLATKTSENEQLKAQLGLKDTEKSVAISERDRQLQAALQSNSGLESELTELRAMKLKLKVMKDLKAPHLLKILDRIPNMTDEEALKTVMSDFNSFAADLVQEREQQLLSGMTPPLGGGGVPLNRCLWTPRAGPSSSTR